MSTRFFSFSSLWFYVLVDGWWGKFFLVSWSLAILFDFSWFEDTNGFTWKFHKFFERELTADFPPLPVNFCDYFLVNDKRRGVANLGCDNCFDNHHGFPVVFRLTSWWESSCGMLILGGKFLCILKSILKYY